MLENHELAKLLAEVGSLKKVLDRPISISITNLYLGTFEVPHPQLSQLAEQLSSISTRLTTMSIDLNQLTERVTEIESTADSAIALLNGISAALQEALASPDPAAVQALADRLAAQTQELADAVVANTPAEPQV
jgi:hypothetical protein